MEGLPQWILCLSLWLAIIQLLLNVGNSMLDGRKLMSTNDPNHDTGFISIDCGARNDYLDQETGFWYQTDNNFVETGTNSRVASDANLDYPYFGDQLYTLRSFPEGQRNCYTLKPNQGKNNTYLIRAIFAYGNYDGKDQSPTFDLYLGVNLCDTVELEGYYYYIVEIIHTPIVDTIDICLVNTGKGVPFISALELRPLDAIYQIPKPSQSLLILEGRDDVASTSSATTSRYKDDIYDRTWTKYNISDRTWYNTNDEELWQPFNTSANIDSENTSDPYKLPAQVLKSAANVHNLSSSLNLDWTIEVSSRYYVYFHFLEIEKLGPGKKRIINITLSGENILSEPLVLEYLKPISISHQNPIQSDGAHFRISATSESDAPPILNAYEVYKFISPLQSPTEKTDADAILDIKNTYKFSKVDWQGDSCLPKENAWEGLICTSGIIDSKPRITSLNLRASKLTGNIATSFSQLTELESLDLSFNDLSGSVPEFLAKLPKLRVLNLNSNKLTGSIPKALKEKSNLLLSLDENPGLCQKSSCESRAQRPIVPIVASIVVVVIVVCISVVLWGHRSKRQRGASDKSGHMKAENGAFSKSEIICITNNFETVIGKGGFGNVYLGTLQDGAQVAVKILSESSRQGFKEFLSEVRLLKLIHHRNLVALVGYCDQEDMKALVYEYMNKGNLLNQLSGKNRNVLKWNERLQIAVDTASGLNYLHNGCKPPIVHRDLKPSNILLNKNKQAKISDFGLSRAFENENDTHILTFPAGTLGYIDPQFHTSKKSDIYSFGIILFEIITGKPAVTQKSGEVNQILDWVFPLIEKGDIQNIIDPRLQRNFNVTSAQKVIEAAMSCVSMDGAKRPDISHLLAELKECLNMEIMIHESSSSVIESQISIISAR